MALKCMLVAGKPVCVYFSEVDTSCIIVHGQKEYEDKFNTITKAEDWLYKKYGEKVCLLPVG